MKDQTVLPSISATRKVITDRVVRDAIALYHQAELAMAEAEAAFGDDDELEAVLSVVMDRRHDSQRTLIRAILNFSPDRGVYWAGYKPEKKLWPARAVRCDGRLYRVAPAPDCDICLKVGEARHDGGDAMHLTVIDLAEVSDVGTLADDPVYHPDGSRIHHINDETAFEPQALDQAEELDEPPPPRRKPVRVERPPLPLVRTTMTVNSASEPGYLTSIDVVVYDQCLEGQAGSMVQEGQGVAEIRESGWSFHALGPMTIGFRTVC